MIIGFDASRAFNKEKSGTENYSYQLLKHLAKIDQKNKYIVYIRPKTVIPNGLSEGPASPEPKRGESLANASSNQPLLKGASLAKGGSRDSSAGYRNDKKENHFSWPENFKFKVINFPRLWTQAGLALQTLKDPLDILFVPAHTLPLLKKPGLKTVITVHDLGAEYLPQMHQLKQRLYLSWMTQKQLKTATKIIAVSNATKEDIVKRIGIDNKKITVVYEGVNKELFKPVKNDLLNNTLKQFGLKKGSYFFFVGTIQPRKNLARLIEAFAKFTARGDSEKAGQRVAKLVLVGSKGWLSNEIYELPEKLGIRDKVQFLGRVEDKDLPALYSGALALTFPSLFEGFGLPILEAFACHCPVITSDISSLPEVAGNAAIFVDAYDINSISKGLNKSTVMANRVELINRGVKQLDKFSWEKAARETLAVLKETANVS